jgi:hypothetical protein
MSQDLDSDANSVSGAVTSSSDTDDDEQSQDQQPSQTVDVDEKWRQKFVEEPGMLGKLQSALKNLSLNLQSLEHLDRIPANGAPKKLKDLIDELVEFRQTYVLTDTPIMDMTLAQLSALKGRIAEGSQLVDRARIGRLCQESLARRKSELKAKKAELKELESQLEQLNSRPDPDGSEQSEASDLQLQVCSLKKEIAVLNSWWGLGTPEQIKIARGIYQVSRFHALLTCIFHSLSLSTLATHPIGLSYIPLHQQCRSGRCIRSKCILDREARCNRRKGGKHQLTRAWYCSKGLLEQGSAVALRLHPRPPAGTVSLPHRRVHATGDEGEVGQLEGDGRGYRSQAR